MFPVDCEVALFWLNSVPGTEIDAKSVDDDDSTAETATLLRSHFCSDHVQVGPAMLWVVSTWK
jgi:hypothetical protein